MGIQKGRVGDGADSTSSRHLLLFLVGYSGIELTVTKGFDLLTPAKMGPGNPNCETMDDNPNFGGLGRIICSKCGVVMMTALFARPHTELNDGDEDAVTVLHVQEVDGDVGEDEDQGGGDVDAAAEGP